MKPTTLLLLGALAQGAVATPSLRPRRPEPRVLGLDLERKLVRGPVADGRMRRRAEGTLNTTTDNLTLFYLVNMTVGSPPQAVRGHLDTGSSDLWLNTPSSPLCSLPSKPCAVSGTYSANQSSTYRYLASNFNISYVDGTGAAGDYASDNMRINGRDIDSLQFGIGYRSSSPQAVLGVGYPANEAQVTRNGMRTYDNLPAKLAAQGVIASTAYSMWLNDVSSSAGSLLFGGVDTARYRGPLVRLPVQKVGNVFSAFFVTMTGLSLGSTTVADNMALAVLLDSGSSFTYLPDDVARGIYAAVDATFRERDGIAYVPCSLRDSNTSLNFAFSDPASIRVPIREMVLDPRDLTGQPERFRDGTPACYFGVAPSDGSTNVLGDTFLRSAYIVYDLDNNEVLLAETNFNATTSTIKEIGTGRGAVPDAVAARKPVAATSGLPGRGRSQSTKGSEEDSAAGTLAPPPPALLAGALAVLVGVVGLGL